MTSTERAVRKASEWTVLVGNVGTVHVGRNAKRASTEFESYVVVSLSGRGRAGGENVTLLRDGEPVREFEGVNNDSE